MDLPQLTLSQGMSCLTNVMHGAGVYPTLDVINKSLYFSLRVFVLRRNMVYQNRPRSHQPSCPFVQLSSLGPK